MMSAASEARTSGRVLGWSGSASTRAERYVGRHRDRLRAVLTWHRAWYTPRHARR
jgi:hypothetical protein